MMQLYLLVKRPGRSDYRRELELEFPGDDVAYARGEDEVKRDR